MTSIKSMRELERPYFLLEAVSEVTESQYKGLRVGMSPMCFVCRRMTDGPPSGYAEAICFECYELVRGKAALVARSATGRDLADMLIRADDQRATLERENALLREALQSMVESYEYEASAENESLLKAKHVLSNKEPSGSPAPDVEELYYELIMAVGNKYEGETRHQTALRYIREAERGGCEQEELSKQPNTELCKGPNKQPNVELSGSPAPAPGSENFKEEL